MFITFYDLPAAMVTPRLGKFHHRLSVVGWQICNFVVAVPESAAAKPKPSRLWRSVRWCRRILFFGVLGILYAGVHLNQIGLPGFLKQPLLDQLRARGITLDFSRLRVRLGRGLVAEHVTIERPGELAGEHFYADEIQLKLDWSRLSQFAAPEIRSLRLQNGLVQIPVPAEADSPPYLFKVDGVSGLLIFLGPEEWLFHSIEAACHGGQFRAVGSLTNASVLRRGRTLDRPGSEQWKRYLRRLGNVLDQAQFSQAPVLSVAFHADLRSPRLSTAAVELTAPGVRLGENDFTDITAVASLNQPQGTNNLLPATLRVEAVKANTPWGTLSDFTFNASGDLSATNAMPDRVDWSILARAVGSTWASTDNLSVTGHTISSEGALDSHITLVSRHTLAHLTNAAVAIDQLQLQLDTRHSFSNWFNGAASVSLNGVSSPWAKAGQLSLQFTSHHLRADSGTSPLPAFWQRLSNLEIQASVRGSNIVALIRDRNFDLIADRVSTSLSWTADHGGDLSIHDFSAVCPAGSLGFGGALNAVSRRFQGKFGGALDLLAFRPLLTPAARKWISQYGWLSNQPPVISGAAAVTLPVWTNRQPDWRRDVVPTLSLQGLVAATNVTFRGLSGESARGEFSYTNHIWRIPSLTALRPDGSVEFSYEGHELTREYNFHVRSSLDPRLVRPLLEDERTRKALAEFELSAPPLLEGDIWGVWKERDRSGFDVRLAATNFVFRNETIESLTGRVRFTNSLLAFSEVDLRSGGAARIPGGAFDFASQRLSLTNAQTLLDPHRVARVIGAKSARVMSNYLFAVPPATTLNGVIGVRTNIGATDIYVTANAPVFHWWRLGLSNATARLHFAGETLAITDLKSDFHGGEAKADLFFDWSQKDPGSSVHGWVSLTNLHLSGLMHTLVSPTNRLEGVLAGQASFAGLSSDTNSWSGSGHLVMRDGFLWDVPLFGIFSKLFDAISPGAGQTRFNNGHMSFVATNGVLTSRDLEVRSPAMRLGYRGSVDSASRLDARMEAELFRDAPLIGPLLTLVLTPFTKLFIYDVKGTLKKPVAEPRYVPKIFLAPLRPFKTIRDLMPKDEPANSSPIPPPKP